MEDLNEVSPEPAFLQAEQPELDAGLQMGSHQSRAEGQNHLLATLLLMQPRIQLAFLKPN